MNSVILWIYILILNFPKFCSATKVQCPSECLCTKWEVDCSGLDLTRIPDNIPSNVETLNLEGNELRSLSRSDFRPFRKLKKLQLKGNQVEQIEVNTFYRLKKLEILDLSDNLIRDLRQETFSKMPRLTTLGLSNNNIENIDRVVRNLKSLATLQLSFNQIADITFGAFQELPNLRYLDLDNNNITFMAANSFWPLGKLSYINIRNNPLRNIDGIFKYNNLLTYMELTDCELDRFPSELPPGIRYLQMGTNNITEIETAQISSNANLQVLVLDNNQISNIQDGSLLPLTKLIELWLSNNNLSAIPYLPKEVRKFHINNNLITTLDKQAFPMQSFIEELYIQGNQIRSIQADDFENLPKLRKLSIGGNQIEYFLDGVFSPLSSLEYLNLDMNDFKSMEREVFSGLRSLKHLSMSRIMTDENSIHGNIFENLTSLRRLELQESPAIAKSVLSSPKIMSSLYRIEELNLMDNEIATFSENFKKSFPHLSSLKISGNPFHCDVRLLWLKRWLEMDPDIFYTPNYIECYTPTDLYGELIITLPEANFVPTTLPPVYLSTVPKTKKRIQILNVTHTKNSDTFTVKPTVNSPRKSSASSGNGTQFLAIVISVSTVTFILILITVAYFIYRRRKARVFHNGFSCSVTNGLTVPSLPPRRLTRQERGSTTSQTGEDITNNGSSKMKVYTWDN